MMQGFLDHDIKNGATIAAVAMSITMFFFAFRGPG